MAVYEFVHILWEPYVNNWGYQSVPLHIYIYTRGAVNCGRLKPNKNRSVPRGLKNMPWMDPGYAPHGPQIWVRKSTSKYRSAMLERPLAAHLKEGGRGRRLRPPSFGYQYCGPNFRGSICGLIPGGPVGHIRRLSGAGACFSSSCGRKCT